MTLLVMCLIYKVFNYIFIGLNIIFFRYLLFFFICSYYLGQVLNGFLLKKTGCFFFFDLFILHFFMMFFKNSLTFKLAILMDIFVIDYSLGVKKSYEITYCFLNLASSLRCFFKTYSSLIMPALSLINFFWSAD